MGNEAQDTGQEPGSGYRPCRGADYIGVVVSQ